MNLVRWTQNLTECVHLTDLKSLKNVSETELYQMDYDILRNR